MLICSLLSDSLQPHGLWPARLLCLWDFAGKNTGVGCHALLEVIFPTQRLNLHLLCLLHRQVDSLSIAPHEDTVATYETEMVCKSQTLVSASVHAVEAVWVLSWAQWSSLLLKAQRICPWSPQLMHLPQAQPSISTNTRHFPPLDSVPCDQLNLWISSEFCVTVPHSWGRSILLFLPSHANWQASDLKDRGPQWRGVFRTSGPWLLCGPKKQSTVNSDIPVLPGPLPSPRCVSSS